MVEVNWDTTRREGVTFVTATVTNTQTTPQRVRLESRLDGPVWPPRRNGVTAPEWNGPAWEATVDPGRSRGVGFSSPAAPTAPPVELVEVSRGPADADRTPEEILASLEKWAPTSDVLTPEP